MDASSFNIFINLSIRNAPATLVGADYCSVLDCSVIDCFMKSTKLTETPHSVVKAPISNI